MAGEEQAEPRNESAFIEELVIQCLDRFESEGAAAVEAVCGEHPAFAERLRARMEALRDAGLVEDDAREPKRDFPERLGDFRLLERLGGGGMGVVYLARQESLGREVALKLIRPEQLYFPGARERFRREIEAVARLQHPGVVPIYTVGDEGGIPYFAMERVQGCTLAEVIEALAGREPRTLSGADFDRVIAQITKDGELREPAAMFAGTWAQACVRIVREAADALEHVHRRGVLHRDVKPSNVMVTRSGRVMLFDFGLASAQGVDRMTKTGSQLGSVAYMSPEQVRGEFRDVGARSDVYSLGVVLYELLSLELPFDGDTPSLVRQRIEAGHPRSIHAHNAGVDWEVETVCLTAMESERERRYASAEDFAHDLTNLLEHRPIAARRASVGLRARRWVQRHPAASVGAVLGAVLLVGGPSLYAWQQRARSLEVARKNAEIEAKNRELQLAFDTERELRAESDAQRARAERNFGSALEAVRTMLKEVGGRELQSAPEMEETRRALLEKALAFFQRFVRDAGGSAALQVELAQTQRYIGDVAYELNQVDEACEAYRASIAAFRALHAAEPDRAEHSNGLSNTETAFARVLGDEAQHDEALELLDEAVALARANHERAPAHPQMRSDFARALRWRAMIAKDTRRIDDAERDLEEALRVCREPDGSSSEDPELLDVEATALNTLGLIHYFAQRVPEAREHQRRAVAIRQRAFEQTPGERWTRIELAEALSNLGMMCWAEPDPSEAEEVYRRALEVQASLVRDFPRIAHFRNAQATIALNLGLLLHKRRQDSAQAEPLLLRAIELMEALVAERPNATDYQYGLGSALGNLAALQRDLGRLDEAQQSIERSLVAQRAAVAASPQNVAYVTHLRTDSIVAADVYIASAEHARAAEHAREAGSHSAGDWTMLGYVATRLAKCVPLAQEDATLDDAQRAELVERYTTESLDALQAAVETGQCKWDQLGPSAYLDAVREDPRFARIAELARAKVD